MTTLDAVDAVLIDLDGTLIDSRAALTRAWTRWAGEFGVTREAFEALAAAQGTPDRPGNLGQHGRTSASLVAELLPPGVSPEKVRAAIDRIAELEETDVDGVVALPGAHDLMAALPAGRRAIVTSGTRGVARARARAAGLPETLMVTADDVRHGKPHPEPFLLGAGRLGVPPERCLVLEDAPAGLAAARAAGMRSVALTTNHPADDLRQATAIVESLQFLRIGIDGGSLTVTVSKPA
ncbi:MAG TPA: HAD-IA family hydrolase [Actinopolymorphaceae bacterium]